MRGILRAYGVSDRKVYVADSFAGVPPPFFTNTLLGNTVRRTRTRSGQRVRGLRIRRLGVRVPPSALRGVGPDARARGNTHETRQ